MNELLQAVLSYAARGWACFPIHRITPAGCSCHGSPKCSPGKHPATARGLHDASADARIIRNWWQRAPWNIGLVTGERSGFVVLDIDEGKGGEESLCALARRYGRLPATVEALTGGGGRHVLFAHPGLPIRNRQEWSDWPGLDIRGDGGYIVAPPSLHASGRRYEWEASSHPDDVPLAPLPGWLLEILTAGPKPDTQHRTPNTVGPPVPFAPIYAGCGWVRNCIASAKTLGEGAWYGLLGLVIRCEGGPALCHKVSRDHPKYSPAETQAKARHALTAAGPPTCARICSDLGGERYCRACPNFGRITSPINLGRVPEPPPGYRCQVGTLDEGAPCR